MDEQHEPYQIDGERFQDTDDFCAIIGEAVNGPGGYFGRGVVCAETGSPGAAIFGAPVAHDDDAPRAVRATRAIARDWPGVPATRAGVSGGVPMFFVKRVMARVTAHRVAWGV